MHYTVMLQSLCAECMRCTHEPKPTGLCGCVCVAFAAQDPFIGLLLPSCPVWVDVALLSRLL